jgi:2-C-methyl-D-erythritol 4-phosphate cytidylyltransferase
VPDRAALVIVAAGEGRRLGSARRKALVPLAGRPLLEHALRRLLPLAWLEPVVVVGHRDDRAELTALLARQPRPVALVDGGERRQDSVLAGVRAASGELVLVHDAARPFVPVERLPELAERARAAGAALLAVPVADTIKEAREQEPSLVARTLPRDRLRAAQTPQAFHRGRLLELLARAAADGTAITDEAALFETAGLAVAFVEGSPRNFKITTAEDLALAEALLAAEMHREKGRS